MTGCPVASIQLYLLSACILCNVAITSSVIISVKCMYIITDVGLYYVDGCEWVTRRNHLISYICRVHVYIYNRTTSVCWLTVQ